MLNRSIDKGPEVNHNPEQYHSVEFSIKGLELPYQVRIWDNASESMSILVREDSNVIKHLKVGDTLDTKYYSSDSIYPSENMRTLIRHITKNNKGRLRGHYLIELRIVNS